MHGDATKLGFHMYTGQWFQYDEKPEWWLRLNPSGAHGSWNCSAHLTYIMMIQYNIAMPWQRAAIMGLFMCCMPGLLSAITARQAARQGVTAQRQVLSQRQLYVWMSPQARSQWWSLKMTAASCTACTKASATLHCQCLRHGSPG